MVRRDKEWGVGREGGVGGGEGDNESLNLREKGTTASPRVSLLDHFRNCLGKIGEKMYTQL